MKTKMNFRELGKIHENRENSRKLISGFGTIFN